MTQFEIALLVINLLLIVALALWASWIVLTEKLIFKINVPTLLKGINRLFSAVFCLNFAVLLLKTLGILSGETLNEGKMLVLAFIGLTLMVYVSCYYLLTAYERNVKKSRKIAASLWDMKKTYTFKLDYMNENLFFCEGKIELNGKDYEAKLIMNEFTNMPRFWDENDRWRVRLAHPYSGEGPVEVVLITNSKAL